MSRKTIETLNNILPHYWSRGNPVDVLGEIKADRYKAVVATYLDDENVDGLLIIYSSKLWRTLLKSPKALWNYAKAGYSKQF